MSSRRQWRRELLALLLLAAFSLSPLFAQTSPFETLQDVVQHQEKIVFEGVKVIARWQGTGVSFNTVRILKEEYHELFQYLPLGHHPFQTVIINRKAVYYLNTAKYIAFQAPFSYHGPKENIIMKLAAQNYTWEDEGNDTVAGFPTEKISATPLNSTTPEARFWVSLAHHLILREERYDPMTGKPYFLSYFSYIKFASDIADDLFEVPPSYRISQLRTPEELEGEDALKALDFKPLMPRNLPRGFELVGTYVTRWRPHGKLELLYSDGLRDFSIYEEVRHGPYVKLKESQIIRMRGHYVEFLQTPGGRLVRFAQGQLTIAVVGNLPSKSLSRVALSIATPMAMRPAGPLSKMTRYFFRGLSVIEHFIANHN